MLRSANPLSIEGSENPQTPAFRNPPDPWFDPDRPRAWSYPIDWAMTSLSRPWTVGSGKPRWLRIIAQVIGAMFFLVLAYFFFASIHAALGIFHDLLDAIRNRHYPNADGFFTHSVALVDGFGPLYFPQHCRQSARLPFT